MGRVAGAAGLLLRRGLGFGVVWLHGRRCLGIVGRISRCCWRSLEIGPGLLLGGLAYGGRFV